VTKEFNLIGPQDAEVRVMIGYAITFFIVALIAGALGFWGLAGLAAEIAKILCVVFVILVVISMLRGRGTRL
jgi:uncharacterized membrane protein YtjA (UPF0391 family)